MKKSRRSVTTKVNLIIITALTIGIGGMSVYFGWSLVRTRQDLTRAASAETGDLLYQSIKNFMLPGEAPLAVNLLQDIGLIRPDFNIALYRRNGEFAFSDNTTLENVNRNLKVRRFQPHDRLPPADPQKPIQPWFGQAVGSLPVTPPVEVYFYENGGGRLYAHEYRPLINLPKCTVCHGSDHTVRGVIDVKIDVTSSVRAAQRGSIAIGVLFLLVLGVLAFVLSRYLHRIVISPVRLIGKLCADVTNGDFSGKVVVPGHDEIGELAATVNTMVVGLRERSELTKYVSGSTLRSLQGDQVGKRETRVLLFSDIRGFTRYSEQNVPEKVVGHLNRILELQSQIVTAEGGDVDKFVGDAVVAVFPADAAIAACTAAVRITQRLAQESSELDSLSLGIGIASGDVIEGMIGSAQRADFTVIGDAVNVASRLCSLAKAGQILVSQAVRDRAASTFRFAGPASTMLKGKESAQSVYALQGRLQT